MVVKESWSPHKNDLTWRPLVVLFQNTPANMKDTWKYVGSGVIKTLEMDVSILEGKDSKNELWGYGHT